MTSDFPRPGWMRVDPLFDGWWIGVPDTEDEERHAVQVKAGDEYDLEWVGPQPTREHAESFLYRDSTRGYWEHGITVWAGRCPGCGWFAKRLAGDDRGRGWTWAVTECGRCGIIDTRRKWE